MSNGNRMLCALCGAHAVNVCMDCGRPVCRKHGYDHHHGRRATCHACWHDNRVLNAEFGPATKLTKGAAYMHVSQTIENALFILRSTGLADDRNLRFEVVNLAARFMRNRKALNRRVAATAIVWHVYEHLHDTAIPTYGEGGESILHVFELNAEQHEQVLNLKQILDKWAAKHYWRD